MSTTRITGAILDSLITTLEAVSPDDVRFEPRLQHDAMTRGEDDAAPYGFRRFWLGFPRQVVAQCHIRPKEQHPSDWTLTLDLYVAYPYPLRDRERVAGMALDDATQIIHAVETGWAGWQGADYSVSGCEVDHGGLDDIDGVMLVSQFSAEIRYNRDDSY